jgi:muramoyltetrapeptide carboxypeptidase
MNTSNTHKNPSKALIPNPIELGDLIGVVSPSGPVDSMLLEKGISFLRNRDFRVALGRHANDRTGYLAGSDEYRASDLNAMLTDPEIGCILFARGGYGVMRILDSLKLDNLRSRAQLLVGMSDLTALQLSLFTQVRLVTYSGPMVAGQIANGLDSFSELALMHALTKPLPGRELLTTSERPVTILRHGSARGFLLGGCLSIITALLGTSHMPDFTGAIVFLEDVNEPLYRLDRMLTHLKLAGVFDRIKGIVLGHFIGPKSEDLAEPVEELALRLVTHPDIPVVSRYPHGHALPNITLPHGAPVRLTTDPLSLSVFV